MANTHTYSRKEEMANAATHAVGVVLSLAALTILIVFASIYGTFTHVISFIVFGVTMLLLYTNSTLLHMMPAGKVKDLFEIFDHASIYLFIAGTYTPIMLIVVPGAMGWVIFGVVWGLAVAGVVFKVFFVKRFLFISTILYILLGWLAIVVIRPIMENMSSLGLVLLIAGGVCYTVGTIFYMWKLFPYHHAVWHVFVLAGSACHFFMVLSILQIF
ncbi:PAQR family membrane homeostasis protein TrhA [Bacillus horti]|uniref:Hemolysin III n=1 Tax=Caldalkalibacillus horti TaxID=77523 RepID=A0ABT9W4L0_9BACI|nr:hemolysin III family protein [Bacillus horti]MDQ0168189.1 hemolysin III [Bacillus horti]